LGLGVELGGGAQGESGEGDGAESAHEEEAGGDRDVVGGLRSVVALFCRSEGGMDKIWTSFRGSAPDEVTQAPQGEARTAPRRQRNAQAWFGGVSFEWALSRVAMGSGRDFCVSRPWRAWRPRPAVARLKPHRPGFSRRHSDGAGAGETRRAGFRAPKNRPGEPADSPGWAPRDRRRSLSMASRVGRAAKPGRADFGPGRLSRARSPPERFGRSSRRRGPGRAWAVSAVVGVSPGAGNGRSSREGNSPAARSRLRDRPPRRSHPRNSSTHGYRPAG
jgi:hypothetical protein